MNQSSLFRRGSLALLTALTLGACGSNVLVGNDGTGGKTIGTSVGTGSSTSTSGATGSSGSSSAGTSGSGGSSGGVPGDVGACCGGTIKDPPPMCKMGLTCIPSLPDLPGTCGAPGQKVSIVGNSCGSQLHDPAWLCPCKQTCVVGPQDGACEPTCEKNEDCASGICNPDLKVCGCASQADCDALGPMLLCEPQAKICVTFVS